jgi:hypothetical protein
MRTQDTILDRPILSLSDQDELRLRDLVEGTLITGAPGSGKTTTSGKQLAYGLLKTPNSGALILTAKAEETQNWIAYAKACGREKDLILFNAESGHCFDPIHYEWNRPGRGAGDLETVIDFFATLVSVTDDKVKQSHDPFWERGNQSLMRNVIKLLDLAQEPISIASIDRVVKSLPTRPGEFEEAAWQKESYCAQLTASIKARQGTLTPDQWSDLEFATQFIFRKWAGFDERPRSSLEMTWGGMADKFLFNPLHRIFCGGKCTFTPEMTMRDGKIVICDFPILEYGHETGRLCNIILKMIFQRAWLRRKLEESANPVFLWQDEFQYFVVPKWDNFFQQTCRGSRVAVVCLTQNILNLAEQLGEEQPGSKTKSFCGNLAIKIAHQQNEPDTATFMADIIGKEYRYIDNYNASAGDGSHGNTSVGAAQQLVHVIEPIEFTRLTKPDSANPYAQAIVYLSGKPFNATKTQRNPKGRNYLAVLFSREA